MTEAGETTGEERLRAIYGPRGESILRCLAGEWFLVPIRSTPADFRAIFTVNEVGSVIWGDLDGSRALDAILANVLERFDVPAEDAARDLVAFVEQLEGAGLVERRGP